MSKERVFKIPVSGSIGEYVEKRSKFLATLIPVEDEKKAESEIRRLKKKYYDERHNCYAYVVFSQDKEVIERSSDDGEPSGTAGKPILEVITGGQIYNILIVVTRHFGGVLLGTGGLVRAYTAAAKEALTNCKLTEIREGEKFRLNLNYNDLGKVQYLMRSLDACELESTYENDINLVLIIPKDNGERFKRELSEIFSGKEKLESEGTVMYGSEGGKTFIL